jgi:YfiH family protein
MTSDLWTVLKHDWPGGAAGVTQRGPHGHTQEADHAAVDALRHRALAELAEAVGARNGPQVRPASSRQPSVVCAQQVHGSSVTVARHTDLVSLPQSYGVPYYPDCDALITAESALPLTLFYADCCPIILYSSDHHCGGVAHAGWRGTVADMAGSIVGALRREFGGQPGQLQALVGPCIGVECYEVGPEVVTAVAALELGDVGAVIDIDGEHAHLDLLALNIALLQRAGVPSANIQSLSHCTRCGPVPLFSWRRDGPTCGRHVAMFLLT